MKDEESGGVSSARPGSSGGATQHLLRRLQDQQLRAQTPTRYTQSSGGTMNDLGGDSRPQSRASLPAGGARQACRSLGQSGEQRWVDRDQSATPVEGAGNVEAMGESGDVTGRHKQR